MQADIVNYNAQLPAAYQEVCALLAREIDRGLSGAESKVWHAQPVWFLKGNPIVGYSLQKPGIRLMFWSGADFEEPKLDVLGKKFKDASKFFSTVADVSISDLRRWLKKSQRIQWNYKDIVKRRGRLERIEEGGD
jgi:hypothetical protein